MSLPVRPAYVIYQWLWTGLDWLFPPNCGGCGVKGARWCAACQADAIVIQPPICIICGAINIVGEGQCFHCSNSRPSYSSLRSWALFKGSVRNAVHRLKYGKDVAMGEILSRPLIQIVSNQDWKIDLVIPVPLSVARKIERGYNQAALLARPISLATGWAYAPSALLRTRETASQVGLSIADRLINVSGAFEGNRIKLDKKNVLLVDDVTTSGATLMACSQALRLAGANEVYCVTLARAE